MSKKFFPSRIFGIMASTGYSIVEVLVGTLLFSTILIMIIGVFLQNYSVANYGVNLSKGANFAYERMSILKTKAYSELEAMIDNPETHSVHRHEFDYNITSSVSRMSPMPGDQEYEILVLKVEVEWQDISGMELTDERAKAHALTHIVKIESAVSPVSSY